MRACAPGALLCLASAAAFGAMAIFGKLAYDEGATVGTLLARALRAGRGRCSGRWRRPRGGARRCARCRRRDVGIALALGAVRLRAPGRLLLRRARPHRRVAAVAAASTRSRRWSRSAAIALGPRARRRGAGRRAGAGLRRAGARRWPARAPARWTRSAPRSGSPPRSSTRPTSSLARASRGALGPLRARHARVHRRGGHADRSAPALLGDLRPGRRERRRAGAGWPASRVVSTVGAIGLFFAGLRRVGPTAASILVDARAGRHGGARVRASSASRSAPRSSPAARSCSAPSSRSHRPRHDPTAGCSACPVR